MLTPEELMEQGSKAEQALPYITTLFGAAKDAIFDRLIELKPDETCKFTVLKSELICIDELISLVHGDINAGKRAIDIVQENPLVQNGIL